jgi:hypothetical protein
MERILALARQHRRDLARLAERRDTRVPSASRFSALIENCSAMAVSVLTEHVANGFRVMDAPDRLAQQVGDREHPEVRELLPRQVGIVSVTTTSLTGAFCSFSTALPASTAWVPQM